MAEPPFPDVLTKFRELNGLSQKQLAHRVNASVASASRWTNGHALPQLPMAEILDAELGANGKLLAAWRKATRGETWPDWARSITNIEMEAHTVQIVSPVLVPGYLQSPSYASAVFRSGWPFASDEEIVRLTKIRAQVFGQLPRLRITAVFPMTALTGVDEAIRREQVAHLLDLVGSGRVVVHLVPEGSILMEPPTPMMAFRLHSGELVITSDNADGNVIHAAHTHERLHVLITGALAVALPARHSLEALRELV
ncbi:transcriptional regulator with XRE-family HTH domain [Nocardiopsis arvandica]|uniref:Transcriptional regulator with XRE-family HTH domain n=1 Tax=Nocardiopsis sinuspersici TaxID=501010 RepID=A0A7Z0BIA7_9ACTN|nr:Scr1 family TA system antitoxin-like transcriptional regulator [Nocardiopsis sinuspersici]NYH51886.1 transcriptional regulator with XRE-family HTH domain [Nocardiopsis sinuspersici]